MHMCMISQCRSIASSQMCRAVLVAMQITKCRVGRNLYNGKTDLCSTSSHGIMSPTPSTLAQSEERKGSNFAA